MLILAIDTALDACSPAVLDCDAGKTLPLESRGMERRPARALQPPLPRGMEAPAASIAAARWPAQAPPPYKLDAQPAPDIIWVAWMGAAVSPETAPARPYYLRAPDAKPPRDPLHNGAQPSAP